MQTPTLHVFLSRPLFRIHPLRANDHFKCFAQIGDSPIILVGLIVFHRRIASVYYFLGEGKRRLTDRMRKQPHECPRIL